MEHEPTGIPDGDTPDGVDRDRDLVALEEAERELAALEEELGVDDVADTGT